MTGLYDNEGILRFAGRDQADCLAYAELFDLSSDVYILASLVHDFPGLDVRASHPAG